METDNECLHHAPYSITTCKIYIADNKKGKRRGSSLSILLLQKQNYAANAFFAMVTIVANAGLSWIAISAKTRRSNAIFAFFKPAIKRL